METVKKISINGETRDIAVEWGNVESKPAFARVATSGAYSDLSGAPGQYVLPTADADTLGGVKVTTANGLKIDGGQVSVDTATTSRPGTVTATTYKNAIFPWEKSNLVFKKEDGKDICVVTLSNGLQYKLDRYTGPDMGIVYYGAAKGPEVGQEAGYYENPSDISLTDSESNVVIGTKDLNTGFNFSVDIKPEDYNNNRFYVFWIAVPSKYSGASISGLTEDEDISGDFTCLTNVIEGYKVYFYLYDFPVSEQHTIKIKN